MSTTLKIMNYQYCSNSDRYVIRENVSKIESKKEARFKKV